MRVVITRIVSAILLSMLAAAVAWAEIPRLVDNGNATQLIVGGKPFTMLAGELHNSSASSLEYMEDVWDRLEKTPMNAVLLPVTWELLEPEEGRFEFALVDGLIEGAREHGLKLVITWFGTWKNGQSSYCPPWVKTDLARFHRARDAAGRNLNVVSTFSEAALEADAKAYAALMRHIREVDEARNTVVMMQVENEVGLPGTARDYSAPASEAFAGAVPGELMSFLVREREALLPETREIWGRNGFRESGTWAEVFGGSDDGHEVFSAWHYARYIDRVAADGKEIYPLPMFVNAWLIDSPDSRPGVYLSGGPVSKMMDIWRAGAPHIDLLAPDIYLPDFKRVTSLFDRAGNTLFIPETTGDVWFPLDEVRVNEASRTVFWALAEHDAIGFAPFGIEGIDLEAPLYRSYRVLAELLPEIERHQGTGDMRGILQQGTETGRQVELGGYTAQVSYGNRRGPHDRAYGLLINTGPDEFLIAGDGFTVAFTPVGDGPGQAGITEAWEWRHLDGKWVRARRLNGDETAHDSRIALPPATWDAFDDSLDPRVVRIKLFRHE